MATSLFDSIVPHISETHDSGNPTGETRTEESLTHACGQRERLVLPLLGESEENWPMLEPESGMVPEDAEYSAYIHLPVKHS